MSNFVVTFVTFLNLITDYCLLITVNSSLILLPFYNKRFKKTEFYEY